MPDTSALPVGIQSQIDRFVCAARDAFAEDLVSAVLFGSAAEGRLRATSDVNLLLVLERFDPRHADGLRTALRTSRAAIGLQVMFLLRDELPLAAEAFAVKFGDMLTRRRVIHGPDPLAGVEISPEALRDRLVQVALNLSVRLRERYVMVSLREEQLSALLADTSGPLRACAEALLRLEGRPADSPRQALERLAPELDPVDGPTLLRLVSESREHGALPPGEGRRAVLIMMHVVQRLHERARRTALAAPGARP